MIKALDDGALEGSNCYSTGTTFTSPAVIPTDFMTGHDKMFLVNFAKAWKRMQQLQQQGSRDQRTAPV